jgi:Nif-specific ferredoxin III
MTEFHALRRDGTPWVPMFIEAINGETCIGCGRCFKVCTHDVLAMMGMTEDDELVAPDDDEVERMVMTIANIGNCVGCESCVQVCGSKSITLISATDVIAA